MSCTVHIPRGPKVNISGIAPHNIIKTMSGTGTIVTSGYIPENSGFSPVTAITMTHEDRNFCEEIIYSEVHSVGSILVGRTYKITNLDGTDFTLIGSPSNEIGQEFVATGSGKFSCAQIIPNYYYTIVTVGSTDFTLIGAPSNTIGIMFKATAVGVGSGSVTTGAGRARTYYPVDITAERPMPTITTTNSTIEGKYVDVFTNSSQSYTTEDGQSVTVNDWGQVDDAIADGSLTGIYRFLADPLHNSLYDYTASTTVGSVYTTDISLTSDTSMKLNKLKGIPKSKEYTVDVENRYTMGKYELMIRLGKNVGIDWINNTNQIVKWNNNSGDPVYWLSDI